MKNARKCLFIVFITCLSYTAFAGVSAAPQKSARTAVLAEVEGTVEVKPPTEKAVWVAGSANTALAQGDIIRSGDKSFAIIHIKAGAGNAVVELKEHSQMTLVELARDISGGGNSTLLSLDIGQADIKTKKLEKKSKFEIKTPTSIIAAQGGSASFAVTVERLD